MLIPKFTPECTKGTKRKADKAYERLMYRATYLAVKTKRDTSILGSAPKEAHDLLSCESTTSLRRGE